MNANTNFNNEIIDNLCKRYASGRSVKPRAEAVADVRESTFDRATINGTRNIEIRESEIERHKNGNQYMTSDDFAAMFRERRTRDRYDFESRRNVTVSTADSTRFYDKNDMSSVSEVITAENSDRRATFERSYNDDNIVTERELKTDEYNDVDHLSQKPVTRIEKVKAFFSKAMSVIKNWVDYDPKVLKLKKGKSTFPVVAFISVIVIVMSLFLIVSSSVKLMKGEREESELKNDIAGNEESLFDRKYDLPEIEKILADKYGMTYGEYGTSKHFGAVNTTKEAVDLFNTDINDDKTSIVNDKLLCALGMEK